MSTTDTRPIVVGTTQLRWWREVLYVAFFYGLYSAVRNLFGSANVEPRVAFEHATEMIRLEQAIGLYHESTIQGWFIDIDWFIRFWNIFYGTAHFVVTIGAMVWLFARGGRRYPLWRNTLACTTTLALIGFSSYPLMPPRLLNDLGPYGGGPFAQQDYGFVDTLASVGGLWSFDSGTVASISNQFAAMPSLHCAWATWCALVMWPMVRRPWIKAVVALYPWATLFCIIVTANHYWIDGIGGLITLGAGFLLARRITDWTIAWSNRSDTATP